MTSPVATTPFAAAAAPSRARPAARLGAALAGLALLAVVALPTAGIALAAPLGVLVAGLLVRRRGRRLTRGRSWVAAVASSALVFAAFMAVVLLAAPPGSLAKARAASQTEARRQDAAPPAWLERIAPGAAARARSGPDPVTQRLLDSTAFYLWAGVVGGGLVSLLIGAVAGTAGWPGAVLLGYAATGRWPERGGRGAAYGEDPSA